MTGRILGVDYGTKRVGIAISDPMAMLATPLSVETVQSVEEAITAVCRIARDRGVVKIVVGIPINMNGSSGPMALEAGKFVELLRTASGLPVDITDERLSTSLVERMLLEADVSRERRKEVRDKLAAQVILQGYLDTKAEANYVHDPDDY
ncbi:MAG: Holliday junction resolvase RuvX [bacterium]|jgi:putative Holliday junction resolvase